METKRKENETLHRGPWNFCNRSNQVLRRTGSRGGAAGWNPASSLAGGECPAGERQEDGELYPWVVRVGLGVAGGGLPAVRITRVSDPKGGGGEYGR